MDDLSVSLVLALQLEDVDTLLRGSKGKNPEGRQSDVDIALAAYREELQKNEMIFTDRRMGKSISEAVQRDGSIIATARLEEHTAIRDREVACHLGGVQRPKRIALEDFAEIDADDDVVRRLCTLNICDINDYNDNDDERDNKASSSKTSRGGSKALGSKKQCVACQEDRPIFDILAAPCTHNYCRDCVSGLFEAATTDESLFPPRCCRQTIPLTSVKTFLSAALIQRFKAKAIELKSPDRTYCFRPTCSAFIPKERISGDVATCPDCLQTTCTVCKSASHAGECPNDTALQRLLHTATANGWQRCYACRRLVELELGCNHMTCGFWISLFLCFQLMAHAVAYAALSFATSAVNAGSIVLVRSGTKTASSHERLSS
ncbi:MAG: hypothetical protein M1830_005678 [Pleopsidium flavum]|nr:MAG: hypothetical protein M1830_005678 [Pleopsidium flavum]